MKNMKDYSDFIKGKKEIRGAGFVTGYDIQGEELQIHTSALKSKKPIIHDATKEEIEYIEKRLENQWNLIIENKDEIIKYNKSVVRKVIYTIGGLLILGALIPALTIEDLTTAQSFLIELGRVAGVTTIGVGEFSLALYREMFKDKTSTYKEYISKRKEIEESASKDKNITMHLTEDTLKLIAAKKELKNAGKIDNVFNMDLMDKMTLKELRELLLRFKTIEKLEEEQVFCVPNTSYVEQQNTPAKKRMRKQEHGQ